MTDELYMQRCLELARNGDGFVSPNPMVGCVIVCDDKVIGEGWHMRYGEAHAEVNAINSVRDRELLKKSTLYVNLEPCCHWGKTPPCSDLIIETGIPRVVVGMTDPNALVGGGGIARLKSAGVDVKQGVLEEESKALNAHFITYMTSQRPYITLKWAQTADRYIDNDREPGTPPTWMTGRICKTLVYQMRKSHDAIMTGTNTIERDNPTLKAGGAGPDPLRVVVDRRLRLSPDSNVFDGSAPTVLYTSVENVAAALKKYNNCELEGIDFAGDSLGQIIGSLYKRKIQSLFVEGGSRLFASFIERGLWDEMNVFTAPMMLADLKGGRSEEPSGVKAPEIKGEMVSSREIDGIMLIKTLNK